MLQTLILPIKVSVATVQKPYTCCEFSSRIIFAVGLYHCHTDADITMIIIVHVYVYKASLWLLLILVCPITSIVCLNETTLSKLHNRPINFCEHVTKACNFFFKVRIVSYVIWYAAWFRKKILKRFWHVQFLHKSRNREFLYGKG